jgi:hypothetical protein
VALGLESLLANLSLLVVIDNQSRALLGCRNGALDNNGMPCTAIGIGTTTRSDANWMVRQSMTLPNRIRPLLTSDSVNYRTRSQKFTSHKIYVVAWPNVPKVGHGYLKIKF